MAKKWAKKNHAPAEPAAPAPPKPQAIGSQGGVTKLAFRQNTAQPWRTK